MRLGLSRTSTGTPLTSTGTRPEHRRDTTAASRLEHRRNSTGLYAACIAGVARGMVAAWPSFLAYVEPHVAGVFINLAAPDIDNCTRAILEHPKVIRWRSTNSFDRQHGSASRSAIEQHDMRERGCLKLIASQPVVYASVLLTRPDILYAEPFPFAHFRRRRARFSFRLATITPTASTTSSPWAASARSLA